MRRFTDEVDEADAPPERAETSLGSILTVSAPAILKNSAAPLAAACQLAFLGHAGASATASVASVAAFTAIGAVTQFVASVCNFVIVVTMARVGHALGAQRWGQLGSTVRTVLFASFTLGTAIALALWIGRVPLLALLSLTTGEERRLAALYLPVAVCRLPPLLLLNGCSSVLCGYQRVRTAAAINVGLAVVDTAVFYVTLHSLRFELPQLGGAIALSCALAALAALAAVLATPPDPSVRVCDCMDAPSDGESDSDDDDATKGGKKDGSSTADDGAAAAAKKETKKIQVGVRIRPSKKGQATATAPDGQQRAGAW